jgi:hypothetical protein
MVTVGTAAAVAVGMVVVAVVVVVAVPPPPPHATRLAASGSSAAAAAQRSLVVGIERSRGDTSDIGTSSRSLSTFELVCAFVPLFVLFLNQLPEVRALP